MTTLHYTQVLLASGWADNVRISIDEIGSISKIETGIAGGNSGCLLPESPTYILAVMIAARVPIYSNKQLQVELKPVETGLTV